MSRSISKRIRHQLFQSRPGLAAGTLVLMLAAAAGDSRSAEPNPPPQPGGFAKSINKEILLPTTRGEKIGLSKEPTVRCHVVCFLGTECPLARLYGTRLASMAREFQPQGVAFLGINSNRQDSMVEMKAFQDSHQISFPLAKDHDGTVAAQFGATRTPEVFVLDADRRIVYQGRVDDQYQPGISRAKATKTELRDAIEAVLANRSVAVSRTEAPGCLIGRPRKLAKEGTITFCDQVSRILNDRCVECHRPGEIGPFSLTDYDEIVGWADMILEVIDQGRMPPWHANPQHGDFINAREMPADEVATLKQWVDADMPYGDVSKLPPALPPAVEWNLPSRPEAVFEMRQRPFTVPADGTVEYQYFVVDTGFKEDRWIRGAQVIPGNRAAVHHAIVFVRPPDGSRVRGMNWLGAYVPGQRLTTFPPGLARRIPAGSKLVFQMHYTPNGTETTDVTRVGLLFSDPDEVTHEVYTLAGIEQEFEIPAFAANHAVKVRVPWFPDDGILLGVAPHMHLRGKAFRLFGSQGDRQQVLLDVPRYDFNWQHFYAFRQPPSLGAFDKLEFTAWFDNSKSNPVNPDPSQRVIWGDQTWEEMAIAFFEVAEPLEKEPSVEATKPTAHDIKRQRERNARVQKFVAKFFKRFDANLDGFVVRDETPESFARHGFWRFEFDGDGRLSREEIAEAAEQRLK